MSEPVRPTAEIIIFPGSRPRPEAETPIQSPADRLRQALTQLDQAMADQRLAVAEWRRAIDALRTSVRQLETRLSTIAPPAEPAPGLHNA